MQHPLDAILLSDDLSPAQEEAVRTAVEADPALAAVLAGWQQIRTTLRAQLHDAVPDRRLFILYALDAAGRSDVIVPEERELLEAVHPALDQAVKHHPALADIIAHVDDCCADFEHCWDAHLEQPQSMARVVAPDRQPIQRHRNRRQSGLRWGWRVMSAAAVVAFVAVVGLLLQRDSSLTTIRVATGETRLVELADGSLVRLLNGATLTYADPDQSPAFNRHVVLEGNAFFDIAAGQQGFTVETPTAVTTVLGTSFGIQADAQTMEVVLASGRISVASMQAEEQIVVLEPGERSRVARNALPTTPEPVDLVDALEWTGLFLFRATPFQDAVARLSAHYGVSVELAPALYAEGVSGTFEQAQSLEQILQALATTLDASVEGNADSGYRIVMTK